MHTELPSVTDLDQISITYTGLCAMSAPSHYTTMFSILNN